MSDHAQVPYRTASTLVTLLTLLLLGCLISCDSRSSSPLPGKTPFFEAIRAHDHATVSAMLEAGQVELEPPAQPNLNNKPLAYACAWGDLPTVRMILEAGADINGTVAWGDCPLIKAHEMSHRDITEYLIAQGADVNLANAFGMSPFIFYCQAGDLELVQLAHAAGGVIDQTYPNLTSLGSVGVHNISGLQWAVAKGHLDVVQFLVAQGADLNQRTPSGDDLQTLARRADDPAVGAYLTRAGSLEARDEAAGIPGAQY